MSLVDHHLLLFFGELTWAWSSLSCISSFIRCIAIVSDYEIVYLRENLYITAIIHNDYVIVIIALVLMDLSHLAWHLLSTLLGIYYCFLSAIRVLHNTTITSTVHYHPRLDILAWLTRVSRLRNLCKWYWMMVARLRLLWKATLWDKAYCLLMESDFNL